jgi:hypothetical protein
MRYLNGIRPQWTRRIEHTRRTAAIRAESLGDPLLMRPGLREAPIGGIKHATAGVYLGASGVAARRAGAAAGVPVAGFLSAGSPLMA